jgi:hypothetical protein
MQFRRHFECSRHLKFPRVAIIFFTIEQSNSTGYMTWEKYDLYLICINASWYHTRTSNFLRVDFHRTNYGVYEPLNGVVRGINFLIV